MNIIVLTKFRPVTLRAGLPAEAGNHSHWQGPAGCRDCCRLRPLPIFLKRRSERVLCEVEWAATSLRENSSKPGLLCADPTKTKLYEMEVIFPDSDLTCKVEHQKWKHKLLRNPSLRTICHSHQCPWQEVLNPFRRGYFHRTLPSGGKQWPAVAQEQNGLFHLGVLLRHGILSPESQEMLTVESFKPFLIHMGTRKNNKVMPVRCTKWALETGPELFWEFIFFRWFFVDFLFCQLSLLFAEFWSWKLPFQHYLQHLWARTSYLPGYLYVFKTF